MSMCIYPFLGVLIVRLLWCNNFTPYYTNHSICMYWKISTSNDRYQVNRGGSLKTEPANGTHAISPPFQGTRVALNLRRPPSSSTLSKTRLLHPMFSLSTCLEMEVKDLRWGSSKQASFKRRTNESVQLCFGCTDSSKFTGGARIEHDPDEPCS